MTDQANDNERPAAEATSRKTWQKPKFAMLDTAATETGGSSHSDSALDNS